MKWNPSEKHWMHRMHMPHARAIHLHPIHWLGQHPLLMALLIATLVTLLIIGLAAMVNTGIRMDVFDRLSYPAMHSFGKVY